MLEAKKNMKKGSCMLDSIVTVLKLVLRSFQCSFSVDTCFRIIYTVSTVLVPISPPCLGIQRASDL